MIYLLKNEKKRERVEGENTCVLRVGGYLTPFMGMEVLISCCPPDQAVGEGKKRLSAQGGNLTQIK